MWYTDVYMLAYDRRGNGAPLLLLHGTNSSRSIWEPLLPRLTSCREVLSVDLPAHGASPPSSLAPPPWTSSGSSGWPWSATPREGGRRWSLPSLDGRAASWRWRRRGSGASTRRW